MSTINPKHNFISDRKLESFKWIRKITAYTISTILYVRNFFDENSYSILDYETTKLRILSRTSTNKNVRKIIEYLQDTFEALEKKYLKSLIIGIFEQNETKKFEKAIETYQFNYNYKTFDVFDKRRHCISTVKNEDDFQSQASNILKNLLTNLQTARKLPKDKKYFISFKLYYHDCTPANYEPPGFVPVNESESTIFACDMLNVLENSKFETQFHSMDIKVKTKSKIEDISPSSSKNCKTKYKNKLIPDNDSSEEDTCLKVFQNKRLKKTLE